MPNGPEDNFPEATSPFPAGYPGGAPTPAPVYPGGTTGAPTPYRPPTPGGGFAIPPGAPPIPDPRDYEGDPYGTQRYQDDYIAWVDIIYSLGGGMPDEDAGGTAGSAAAMAGVQAQLLATHVNTVIAGVTAEIEAGRLNLDQAEAAFNARMDAFAEAGKQRSEMWKWTVPPGSEGQPLHADIRGDLGMKPWISKPMTIDPFAEGLEIYESMPEVMPVPSTQPIQDLTELTRGFLGR